MGLVSTENYIPDALITCSRAAYTSHTHFGPRIGSFAGEMTRVN